MAKNDQKWPNWPKIFKSENGPKIEKTAKNRKDAATAGKVLLTGISWGWESIAVKVLALFITGLKS